MRAIEFWTTVVADRADFLDRLIALLNDSGIRYCVLGGQGVNAYAEPVVSLGLDIAIDVEQLEKTESLLRREFTVERFEHSLNVSEPGSDLRVQVPRRIPGMRPFRNGPRYVKCWGFAYR